jgi:5'-phosphate synthase pdxT subunit
MRDLTIGVLALQGSFAEHIHILQDMEVTAVQVKLPHQLDGLDGLIIPGGESTTIGKLALDYQLLDRLRGFGKQKPTWGTCAGAIFLSRDVHRQQPLLEVMDITVERNAYGRQIASFEIDLEVPALEEVSDSKKPFPGIFIRAPLIESVSGNAEVLATLPDGRIVAARQDHLLATAFHPELTDDRRFHAYFLEMVRNSPREKQ